MGTAARSTPEALRALPAVEQLAARLQAPHALAVAAARDAIAERRTELLERGAAAEGGAGDARDTEERVLARAREILAEREAPSLRRVLNATGVIIHTNLGRAPLADAARGAVARAAEGYSNLELDLGSGRRGSRHDHVESLLRELTGAQAAIAVNNCAGAVLLAAAALAGPGAAVVVSRGQLVEIGGAFRVPEVIAASGSQMVEVGTTNRTRIGDYERALAERAVILRAHPSNFRTLGFVEEVPIEELCALGVPVIDDLGSGLLLDELDDEPPVRRSVRAGAALVCFSGDKLLGGPQAGLLVGRADAVAAARAHPLARALRIDKLSLAALEATLRLYRDPELARAEIPVLAALLGDPAPRAERLLAALRGRGVEAEPIAATAKVGGGSLPLLELPGTALALRCEDPDALAARLRTGEPPLLGRIEDGRLLLDPRTLADGELEQAADAVERALGR